MKAARLPSLSKRQIAPAIAVFEFRAAGDRLAVGEVRHRIDPVDRQAGMTVDHDALGRRGAQRGEMRQPRLRAEQVLKSAKTAAFLRVAKPS